MRRIIALVALSTALIGFTAPLANASEPAATQTANNRYDQENDFAYSQLFVKRFRVPKEEKTVFTTETSYPGTANVLALAYVNGKQLQVGETYDGVCGARYYGYGVTVQVHSKCRRVDDAPFTITVYSFGDKPVRVKVRLQVALPEVPSPLTSS